jgi:hypothetical protein
MEADWEFEVGGDAPVIDARWAGFVDLQSAPGAAWELDEVRELPALAAALERLNLPGSPVWTSKCDFYPALQAGEFDADELDAEAGCAAHGMGCYIDSVTEERSAMDFSGDGCRRMRACLRAGSMTSHCAAVALT